ncbi:MAG: SDR family NAD(P)-dependent oxidoreductase [Ectothiorhodospiraceae bacterium]|nr:SDR family NAD(P)-dependent oxidoreductase [Ectothiorhodospiraceae bacterium]
MSEFDGRVVLVTGAAGALGAAVSDHFAALGATVAQLDVQVIDNRRYSAVCDLTDASACRAAVEAVTAALGPVRVLANIAGGFTMGEAVHETSDETWDFMMGLNARSVLNMARAVVPGMLGAGGGKIVNVGAGAALHAPARMGAYSASKAVVIRLTEAMSAELKGKGINVNCVLPSIIDTERNRQDMPKADFGRWVRPEAMARVIAFLASGDADPIHGAALPVSGLS